MEILCIITFMFQLVPCHFTHDRERFSFFLDIIFFKWPAFVFFFWRYTFINRFYIWINKRWVAFCIDFQVFNLDAAFLFCFINCFFATVFTQIFFTRLPCSAATGAKWKEKNEFYEKLEEPGLAKINRLNIIFIYIWIIKSTI